MAYQESGVTAVAQSSYPLVLLTPAAIHGADPREKAEFRLPSLRGVWRYWWRTLQDEPNHEKLLAKEEEWFGGTRKTKQQSPVHLTLARAMEGTMRENILPHRTSPTFVPALPAGGEVTVTLSVRKRHQERLAQYDWHFQYMLHLASFGQRSRRGFGAVQWTEHQWDHVEEYGESLRMTLERIGAADAFSFAERGCLVARREDIATPHPVLYAVWVGEGKESAAEVVKAFGRASHEANRYGSLGYMRGKEGKLSSPLWCTVRKIGNRYHPIVTEVRSGGSRYSEPRYERDRNRFLEIVGVRI
ncbi:type III-B CRISPR module RAMP protein Cmr1 [Geobacillus sp. FSL K6-0789]|uniref:CRISPR-associated RAMP Cmr1 n=1 Tax=Geobacillus stearothermophilus TaxID=1422 RepID=A0A0K9HQJ9_GEOSE|nr:MULTISPECIES: type III-B CRISPR module RAMP protein Cmr1 [Geobacillus]KAF6509475.1 CRISPR-associated RAMP Cmr1 [Geobacillus stearothermophilus]KMY61161.1 CRISPR-associated protein [Geobacillus stearothermophilus]KMY63042.1 CRISPR-associated protein [Geobacillus stearothermophilus]MBR2517707.1 type III-B CRISPR module RAMP protein Cmr1 [Geobacillus sp.]OAO80466.1 CRISPR-associated RAMP Cmr1 [Geobacillus stearothermophilus]